MTTFAPLSEAQASLSAVTQIRFSPESHATLSAKAGLLAYPKVDTGTGVILVDGQVSITAVAGLVANADANRAGSATLSATTSLRLGAGARTTLLPMYAVGANKAYAWSSTVFEALTSEGSDPTLGPSYAIGTSTMLPFYGLAYGFVGTVGSSEAELSPLVTIGANKPYAGSDLAQTQLAPFISLGNNLNTPTSHIWYEYLVVRDTYASEGVYSTAVYDTITVTGSILAGLLVDRTAVDGLVVSDGIQLSSETSTAIQELVRVLSVQSLLQARPTPDGESSFEDTPNTWVINASTKANSRYQNFDMNSLTKWGDKYVGATSEGLFELSGDTDDGVPIEASITTANTDFGTVMRKRMPYVYFGLKASDAMRIKVYTDDGDENEYEMPLSDILRNQRTTLGRGLNSRYWQFMVRNTNGGDFTIDTAEFFATMQSRRL